MEAQLVQRYVKMLGLKPVMLSELAALHGAQSQPWRVATVDRGSCKVLGFSGDDPALIERRVQSGDEPLAVGDWVVLNDDAAEPASIARVLTRSSVLERGSAHAVGEPQLIAANLDTVFIVAAFADSEKLEGRALRARRLDRYISAVTQGGALPVVVLNKLDLAQRDADSLQALRRELTQRLGGVSVILVSALEGLGLAQLRERLVPGETVAFVGASGVGKSSLVNALLGEQRQPVHEVRSRDRKGRHTTTRRELLLMPSGALLIDTPGVRAFAVVADAHVGGFADIEALAQGCRFNDCAHASEPGCAVRAAVDSGELDPERLRSYLDLESEASRLRAKQAGYERQLEHRQQQRFGRMVREAKDLLKKHKG